MLKVDFHIHSKYSSDSTTEVAEILQYAKRYGLDAIAITDHDSLQGSREARRIRTSGDVEIIPAIEYTLPAGQFGVHLIAVNIDEYICFKDITSAIKELKDRNAALILPHPFRKGTGLFDHLQQGTVPGKEVEFILKNVDYIEALNLKDSSEAVQKTLQYAGESKKPIVSGTDAHHAEYIGLTHTIIESIDGFLKGGQSTSVRAFVKNGQEPDISNLHSILETGNDAYYRRQPDCDCLWDKIARKFFAGKSKSKFNRHNVRSEVADIFRYASEVDISYIDGVLGIMSGDEL